MVQHPDAPSPAPVPALSYTFLFRVQVSAPLEIGPLARGRRRVIPIVGGRFEGSGLAGEILGGGADYQIVRDDDVVELEARYTLKTAAGALIAVRSAGVRHAAPDVMRRLLAGESVDPALVYFRTALSFETGAADLAWLTRAVFVGVGERYPSEVVLRVWQLA